MRTLDEARSIGVNADMTMRISSTFGNGLVRRAESVARGTGCVRCLGFADAAERQAKLRLAYALNPLLAARKLSEGAAARVLGVTRPQVSALRHYRLADFSLEHLMTLFTALDRDIEIVIRRKPRSRKVGRISVVAV